jgi:hypothetical protein
MKNDKLSILVIVIAILSLPCLVSTASAEKAYLSDIAITTNSNHLVVYLMVNQCFTEEMNRAIESGILTTFNFFIHLYERRQYWWDRKIASLEIRHSIKFDNIKKSYEVTLSERENETITVKDFDQAKRIMSEIVALKVIPIRHLKRDRRYQLQMMAQLDKIKLPLYLHYVLFFLSLWDFETDWYTLNFRI